MITEVPHKITKASEEITDLLLLKNAAYGDSALNPLRIFSEADPEHGLKVRIDDKLSRIKNQGLRSNDEDTLNDLIGYLILLKVHLDNA